jgi:glutathione S-transferase
MVRRAFGNLPLRGRDETNIAMNARRITLYSGPLSMFGAKAEIALREKAQKFDLVMVPFVKGDRYEPKHAEVLRINPKRQVPVLVHEGADGQTVELFDSTQIFEYLEDAFPEPPLWPKDIFGRAEARKLELIADEIVFMNIARLFGMEETPDDPVAVTARANAHRHYSEMEARLAEGAKAGREWLAGPYLRRYRLLHGAVLWRAEKRSDGRGDAASAKMAGEDADAAGGAHRHRADGRVAPLGGAGVAGLHRRRGRRGVSVAAGADVKAQLARSGIALAGMAAALVIFMLWGDDWVPFALCVVVVAAGFLAAEIAFRRLANAETRRRDLEERTRDSLL